MLELQARVFLDPAVILRKRHQSIANSRGTDHQLANRVEVLLRHQPLSKTCAEKIVARLTGCDVEQPAIIAEFETQQGVGDSGRIDACKFEEMPSRIEDDELLNLVIPRPETFAYAEEKAPVLRRADARQSGRISHH
ncbi:hypothetical protein [Mesorhizobium sp. M00.F.Ca.ET.216.01.1.1]|uniref:hypothetical protein n=1 Tax=Mesorhizobium sp. M00.F.Ca.ET.216.01.1.1 TaxID=2500528 RepID=UPI001FE0ABE5|nr:hypothetical protein [Mesorhizobium sp. M00.F.Ca.ET.216.01.1.1]